MKKTALASALFFAVPLVAFAAPLSNIQQLVQTAGNIIGSLIPILIALAMVVFFYGLVQYIRKPEWETGKQIMIAGIVSLFIMVAIWGIVIFAAQALGVSVGGSAPAPGIPGYNGGTSSNGGASTNGTLNTYTNSPVAP